MDNLSLDYWRWQRAEESGRDEDADIACRAVFQSVVAEPVVSSRFTANTMAAVAAAAARDARRARRARVGLVFGGVAGAAMAVYFGAAFALSIASVLFVWLLNLLIGAAVWIAGGAGSSGDLWSLLASMGRAAAAFAADPTVTFAILVFQLIAISALVALQRLLGSEGESFE